MSTLSIAARNLARNRRRSLATLLAMAIGVASVLLFGGYSTNIENTLLTAYVRNGGHLQIQHRDFYLYGSGDPTSYGIADYQRILDRIAGDSQLMGYISVVTPTLQFGGIAGNYAAGVSRTVLGQGVVAPDQARMHEWNEFDINLPRERFALAGSPDDSAVVGLGLGRVLRLCETLKIPNCPAPAVATSKPEGPALADDIAALSQQETAPAAADTPPAKSARTIELLASTARGTPNVASLQVVQAEPQPFKELDDVYVLLHLKQAQRLIYGDAAPKATSIQVQLHTGNEIPAVRRQLESVLAEVAPGQPLVVSDFRALNPYYVQSIQLFDTIFGFIYCLIAGIVLFTVGNTMNMAVVERTVEIGTLRSIGLRRGGIRQLFVLEGLLLGVAGALIGLAVAAVLAFAVNHAALTWVPPGSASAIPLAIKVWSEPLMVLAATLGMVVIATLSAFWPAHRAARMVIVEALRHT